MESVDEIDWEQLRKRGDFYPSPNAWEDQTIYFMLADRFSDGEEYGFTDNTGEILEAGQTPPFHATDTGNGVSTEAERAEYLRASSAWCGGNLRGAATKLGYLKRLGVTTIWLSPLLQQCVFTPDSYHGYGTQNFLAIDPHFGTADDLRALVTTAHHMGMYVILDIIFNHTGDVFAYTEDRNPDWRPEAYPVEGFRDAAGRPNLPFSPIDRLHFPDAFPHGAVWPKELQQPECFTRRGKIRNWDDCPEFEEGDFFALKDLHLGQWDENTFHPSAALITLTTVYKYWLAFADLDGFRIDTVKHMPPAAVAYFAQEIRQFAASLGKHRFLLIGEIVGDRTNACRRLIDSELDAALGIGEVPQKIKQIVTGQEAPQSYFDIFANSRREGEAHPDPVWWRNRVVTFFDDHDQVGSEKKERFAALFGDRCEAEYAVLRAATFQVLTLGIPCLYYGTEQGFAGQAPPDLPQVPDEPSKDDCFLRECLFGGAFGAFESKGRHFFQESGWLYQQIAQLLTLRRHHAVLRRGRQYLRPLSLDGESFWLPGPGEEAYWGVIAWSRLLDVHEMVCAINTDPTESHSVFAAVDDSRNGSSGSPLICHYSTDESQRRETMRPEYTAHGYALPLTVPPGGVVVYGG